MRSSRSNSSMSTARSRSGPLGTSSKPSQEASSAPKSYIPFLRWPGGKRWAARTIVPIIRKALGKGGTYYEPFLGGGAVFFSLVPERAVLTDVNAELVNAYRAVRDNHVSIVSRMRGLRVSKDGKGDVVYCDPTYSVAHDNNGFLRYNEHIFSWSDQERLARAAKAAAKRGATVVVSNAHHNSLRTLYAGARTLTLHRPSCVS